MQIEASIRYFSESYKTMTCDEVSALVSECIPCFHAINQKTLQKFFLKIPDFFDEERTKRATQSVSKKEWRLFDKQFSILAGEQYRVTSYEKRGELLALIAEIESLAGRNFWSMRPELVPIPVEGPDGVIRLLPKHVFSKPPLETMLQQGRVRFDVCTLVTAFHSICDFLAERRVTSTIEPPASMGVRKELLLAREENFFRAETMQKRGEADLVRYKEMLHTAHAYGFGELYEHTLAIADHLDENLFKLGAGQEWCKSTLELFRKKECLSDHEIDVERKMLKALYGDFSLDTFDSWIEYIKKWFTEPAAPPSSVHPSILVPQQYCEWQASHILSMFFEAIEKDSKEEQEKKVISCVKKLQAHIENQEYPSLILLIRELLLARSDKKNRRQKIFSSSQMLERPRDVRVVMCEYWAWSSEELGRVASDIVSSFDTLNCGRYFTEFRAKSMVHVFTSLPDGVEGAPTRKKAYLDFLRCFLEIPCENNLPKVVLVHEEANVKLPLSACQKLMRESWQELLAAQNPGRQAELSHLQFEVAFEKEVK